MEGTTPRAAAVFGISFDAPEAYIAAASGATTFGVTSRKVGSPAIPASALVPCRSERVRVDFTSPSHPRGAGFEWPPESCIASDFGVGRFPLVLAWSRTASNAEWTWRFADEEYRLSPYSAIAAGVRESLPPQERPEDRNVALVIPNHWNEAQQQTLLDALRLEGVPARLLWRPIAAALAWLHGANSPSPVSASKEEKLVVLHLGLDSCELTLLTLVMRHSREEQVLVPGRKRPDPHGLLAEFCGMRAILGALTHSPRGTGHDETISKYWNQLWATPWLVNLLNGTAAAIPANREAVFHFDRIADCLQGQTVEQFRQLSSNQGFGTWPGFVSWCRKWRQELCPKEIRTAIVTGPLAGVSTLRDQSLGTLALRELGLQDIPCVIEGENWRKGVLAEGAAIHVARIRAGLPTYLDTLPRLQTVITQAGEPRWIDLLTNEHAFVDGGKTWHRPENIAGLAIPKGNDELRLAVWHDEFRHVREVKAKLPRAMPQPEAVSLAISIEPAQGNARLEVVPTAANVFNHRRVVFDWKRMSKYEPPSTREGYLATLPRIFPELLPRKSSGPRWESAKLLLKNATIRLNSRTTSARVESSLKELIKVLQQKDQNKYPSDATAIGCDGVPENEYQALTEFTEAACERLSRGHEEMRELVTRALAYTSCSLPRFLSFLREQLSSLRTNVRQPVIAACGWCLRDPQDIRLFATVLLERLTQTPTGGNSHWWKAMSEMLRYRGDASRDITNEQAQSLTTLALQTFEEQRSSGRGGLVFRWVSLVIVYLLRRRAFDDAYLEPSSYLAEKVKTAFENAKHDVKRGKFRLLGGAVKLNEQLQLMIDYIDRRGSGYLVLDCTDESDD